MRRAGQRAARRTVQLQHCGGLQERLDVAAIVLAEVVEARERLDGLDAVLWEEALREEKKGETIMTHRLAGRWRIGRSGSTARPG